MKRRILITGATSGIGKALALTLVKKDNTLIISGRNSDALQKLKIELSPLCRDVYVVKADLSSSLDLKHLAQYTKQASVIINSAAEFGPTQNFLNVPSYEIKKALQVNVLAPIILSQSALPEMLRINYGRIINIGSTGGLGAYPLRTPYCLSKSALISFTKTFNSEIRSGEYPNCNNVKSFCICPGPVEGDRLEKQIQDRAFYKDQEIKVMREKFTSILGRVIPVDEVVKIIISLLKSDVESDEIVTF